MLRNVHARTPLFSASDPPHSRLQGLLCTEQPSTRPMKTSSQGAARLIRTSRPKPRTAWQTAEVHAPEKGRNPVTLHHKSRARKNAPDGQTAMGTQVLAPAAPQDAGAPDATADRHHVSRRSLLRVGAGGAALAAFYPASRILTPSLRDRGLLSPDGVFGAAAIELTDSLYTEAFPTSPLILQPFKDALLIPPAARSTDPSGWKFQPGPGPGQQNVLSASGGNEQHQCWSDDSRIKATNGGAAYPKPIVYKFDVKVAQHSFTTSPVLPINSSGQPANSFDAAG